MDLSTLIIDGQAGVKGKPSFDQYLELSKSCEENNNDSDLVKKDAQSFNDMTLEQYVETADKYMYENKRRSYLKEQQ